MRFVVDIDPVAFTVGGLPVRWYGVILIIAAAVAMGVALQEARRRGIAETLVWDGALWAGLAALIGGRILYVLQRGLGVGSSDPTHAVMVWMGGLSFYGGLVGALAALVVFARRRGLPVLVALDVAAPGAAIGQAVGHLGCLIAGDSYGVPTELPWAVVYVNPGALAPKGIPLHPVQAYEALLLGFLFAGLWLGRSRLVRLGDGTVAATYLFGLAAVRFGLFFLRDEPAVLFGLKTAQLLGLGVAALALVLLTAARRARTTSPLPSPEPSRP